MRSSWEVLHTLTAIALTTPILAFYLVIVSEALGYSQPAERKNRGRAVHVGGI